MPQYRAPIKSGVHRVAAIALYRALLTQCRTISASEAEFGQAAQNVIRNSFKRNRLMQSKHELQDVYRAGYEALDRLSSPDTLPSMKALLPRLPAYLTRDEPLPKPPSVSVPPNRPAGAVEPRVGILQARPRVTLPTGVQRRVPYLVRANNLPYLLTRKPMPAGLGAFFRRKLRTRQRRRDRLEWGEDNLFIGMAEDMWDAEMSRQGIYCSTLEFAAIWTEKKAWHPDWMRVLEGGESWTAGYWGTLTRSMDQLSLESDKAMQRTRLYERIIDRETALRDVESRLWKTQVAKAKRLRRDARKNSVLTDK